ncbi:hypothetical protein [Occallatibacter savannae]|nr:hypothetical protein [Occallatibacter savannae]
MRIVRKFLVNPPLKDGFQFDNGNVLLPPVTAALDMIESGLQDLDKTV